MVEAAVGHEETVVLVAVCGGDHLVLKAEVDEHTRCVAEGDDGVYLGRNFYFASQTVGYDAGSGGGVNGGGFLGGSLGRGGAALLLAAACEHAQGQEHCENKCKSSFHLRSFLLW